MKQIPSPARSPRRARRRAAAVAVVGVLTMIASLLAASFVSSPARAATSVDGFVAQWNGRYADYDGAYGAQCVDLFNFYNRDVVGAPRVAVGGASELYAKAPGSHYQKLSAGTAPRKGDVAVWGPSWPYGGGAGHVAVVLEDQGGNIAVLTQNPGATKVSSMTKAHLTGYLRPKNLSGGAGPAPAPAGRNPVGNIDEVSSPANGHVRLRGWAFDPDNSSASIDVHAYIGGAAGQAGTEGYPFRASGSRPDVNNVHRVGGNHGFDVRLNVGKVGTTQVCLYAINIGGGGNVHLGCRAVNIGNPQPKGVLDEVTAYRGGLLKVRGWSFDPDQTSASLRVHVYVGPQPGQAGAAGVDIPANASRPDVNRAFGIAGKHGFDRFVTTKLRGRQQVCTYAINVGNGNHNPQIGCKIVTLR